MAAPIVDERYWPLVISVMPERIEDCDLDPFLNAHQGFLERRQRYAVVSDISKLKTIPDARARKTIAEWSKRLDPLMQRYSVGTGIVISSPLVRGALTALHWLAPPSYPTEIVATRLAAVDAILGIYARVGEPVPPSLRRCRSDLADGRYAAISP